MGKSTQFIGQPVYSQLIKLLDKEKILRISQSLDGERYIKHFDAWHHVVTMLYSVIMRFDSLREIAMSMQVEAHKLCHLGIRELPRRSTLSDANKRRPCAVFEAIYRDLYARYHTEIISDSPHGEPSWMKRLRIIDSTTVSLFSDLIFKGAGRNPKKGKKKGGLKVHTVIYANEGVPSDVKFTSAATHDSFMLRPAYMERGDILAMDRAYIDYGKLEELTQRGVTYVTKMKKNLTYAVTDDTMYITPDGLMEVRIRHVLFHKKPRKDSNEEPVTHHARIITYFDCKNQKFVSLLTNDMEADPAEIIEIYRKRWEIELLFKQIKQNFPLRYFYGESANAIKIQVWVTLIANLLLTILKNRIKRPWSFSGLATVIRIVLLSYYNIYSLLNHPEKDWETLTKDLSNFEDRQLYLFD